MTVELDEKEKRILKAQAALLRLEKKKDEARESFRVQRESKEAEMMAIDEALTNMLKGIDEQITLQHTAIQEISRNE